MCSKAIGMKMKKKEPVGDDDTLPDDLPALGSLKPDILAVITAFLLIFCNGCEYLHNANFTNQCMC